jgi:hypothetical protein
MSFFKKAEPLPPSAEAEKASALAGQEARVASALQGASKGHETFVLACIAMSAALERRDELLHNLWNEQAALEGLGASVPPLRRFRLPIVQSERANPIGAIRWEHPEIFVDR